MENGQDNQGGSDNVGKDKENDIELEFEAMRTIYGALKPLKVEAQNRVVEYVLGRLGLTREQPSRETLLQKGLRNERQRLEEAEIEAEDTRAAQTPEADDELEGVSPVARKWMRRNSLDASQLSSLFSLGVDEIDLVAQGVPGKNVKEKHRNVLLLQGLAGLLSTGVARVPDQKLREACQHYGAYDQSNFSTNMRDFGPDATGGREAGYTLTTRGLAAAATLVKSMTAPAKPK